ncbi:MAG TPA: hypothetical protein VM870_03290, partial [Pyrinomonadaceae bacterium]|nr:hypothetical protein [Pyrinomonadaceae bacterium]
NRSGFFVPRLADQLRVRGAAGVTPRRGLRAEQKAAGRVAASRGRQRFVYVSLYGAEKLSQLAYVRAHEDVVAELERSGIDHAVVRPTGFFYSLAELVKLARRPAMILIGSGDHRTNPIHEDDLASVCVDAIEGDGREYSAGGPQIYTRGEINELAFAALGKKPRMVKVPPAVIKAGLRIVRPFDRRLYELLLFLISVSQVDCVAPAVGARRVEDYYAAFAKTLTR